MSSIDEAELALASRFFVTDPTSAKRLDVLVDGLVFLLDISRFRSLSAFLLLLDMLMLLIIGLCLAHNPIILLLALSL